MDAWVGEKKLIKHVTISGSEWRGGWMDGWVGEKKMIKRVTLTGSGWRGMDGADGWMDG
jgi:hypothetical protein